MENGSLIRHLRLFHLVEILLFHRRRRRFWFSFSMLFVDTFDFCSIEKWEENEKKNQQQQRQSYRTKGTHTQPYHSHIIFFSFYFFFIPFVLREKFSQKFFFFLRSSWKRIFRNSFEGVKKPRNWFDCWYVCISKDTKFEMKRANMKKFYGYLFSFFLLLLLLLYIFFFAASSYSNYYLLTHHQSI